MKKKNKTKEISNEEVRHIARLSKLSLSEKEIDKFSKQLEDTVDYIENLNQINTNELTPTGHIGGVTNVFREDEVIPSLSQNEVLSNSKNIYQGFFKVKAVLEEK